VKRQASKTQVWLDRSAPYDRHVPQIIERLVVTKEITHFTSAWSDFLRMQSTWLHLAFCQAPRQNTFSLGKLASMWLKPTNSFTKVVAATQRELFSEKHMLSCLSRWFMAKPPGHTLGHLSPRRTFSKSYMPSSAVWDEPRSSEHACSMGLCSTCFVAETARLVGHEPGRAAATETRQRGTS